jgi:hypothetical protein
MAGFSDTSAHLIPDIGYQNNSSNNLALLEERIPTPVTEWGYSVTPQIVKHVVWDRERLVELPRFLLDNGGDPNDYRLFFRLNQIPPRSMSCGTLVSIPSRKSGGFSAHPEG